MNGIERRLKEDPHRRHCHNIGSALMAILVSAALISCGDVTRTVEPAQASLLESMPSTEPELAQQVRPGMTERELRNRYGTPTTEMVRETGVTFLVYSRDPTSWPQSVTPGVIGFSAYVSNGVVVAVNAIRSRRNLPDTASPDSLVSLGRQNTKWRLAGAETTHDPRQGLSEVGIVVPAEVSVALARTSSSTNGLFRMTISSDDGNRLKQFTTQVLGSLVAIECDGIVVTVERITQPLGAGSVSCMVTNVTGIEALLSKGPVSP